jgi:hypothetical protein
MQVADDSLAVRVEALRKVISELSPEVTKLQTEQKTVWSWLKSGAGFIAFDVLITIVGLFYGIYLHRIESNNQALLDQTKQQQERLNTSIHETCNLYGMFESFYSDAAKGRFVGGPQQYDNLYIQLQTSADHLQCGLKHVVPGT